MAASGRVLVGGSGRRVKGEGGGWVKTEGETFVFRQILVSLAQRSNPRSPSTGREEIQGT